MTNAILLYCLEAACKIVRKSGTDLFAWLVKAVLCKDLLITTGCINFNKKHSVAGTELYVAVMYQLSLYSQGLK